MQKILEQGRGEGLEKGEIIGQIRLLEKWLGKGQTAAKDFDGYEVERLQERMRELEAEYEKK